MTRHLTPALPMNPKMVEWTPHPGPLPIGSADSANAEREKRAQRLGKIVRRMVHGFDARMVRGNLSPLAPPTPPTRRPNLGLANTDERR